MDNSATTPVDPEVKEEMMKFFSDEYGNASQMYSLGQNANVALILARERVASLIGAKSTKEIIFNSGGTEGDNTALKGVMLNRKNEKKHMITSEIEHPAILNTSNYLEKLGIKVTYLPVDEFGFARRLAGSDTMLEISRPWMRIYDDRKGSTDSFFTAGVAPLCQFVAQSAFGKSQMSSRTALVAGK